MSVVAVRPASADDAAFLGSVGLDSPDGVLVAEVDGEVAGAAWWRGGEIVAEVTPEHRDSAVRLVLVRSLSEGGAG